MKRKYSSIFATSLFIGITLMFVFAVYAESAEKQSDSSGCPFLKAIGSYCGGSKSACPNNKDASPSAACCKGDKSKNGVGSTPKNSTDKGADIKNHQSSNKCCVTGRCCECCISGKCSSVCKCENCNCEACKCSQAAKASPNKYSTCIISGCTCEGVCGRDKMCTCWFNA